MTLDLLPSATKAAVSWAKNQPDLAAIHGGRVGTKLNPTLPAIRVQRVGGSPVEPWEDRPVVQFECWGATEGAADDLSRALVAALPTFRGVYGDGSVHTYTVESGPYYAPDDPMLSDSVRYILTARLVTTA